MEQQRMNKTSRLEQRLLREHHYLALTLGLLAVSALSGIVTHLIAGQAYWEQWTYLIHGLTGVALTLALLPMLLWHLLRTLGLRRYLALLTGLVLLAAILGMALSGLHILVNGMTEALRWIYDWHVILGYVTASALALHLLVHWLTAKNNRAPSKPMFLTIDAATWHTLLVSLLSAFALVATGLIGQDLALPDYSTDPVAQPYQYGYGEHPFRPSQTETSSGGFIDQRQIGGSNACGSCHRQIYDEWSASIHRKAASDPTYVTNINLLEKQKGMATTRYCEGCHAPVALLSGQLTEGGKHAGIDGTLANREGVGCLGCHAIERAIHTKGVASYEYKPGKGYLFADSGTPLGSAIHNLLIRIQPQRHRAEMARPVLRQPEICSTCHSQFMDKDVNDWGWVKMQDEYSAWLMSPYSGQSGHTFGDEAVQRCQDCHFPRIRGNDPSADAQGKIVSHRSLGANTMVPWLANDAEHFRLTKQFLQANRMTISIDQPTREDASRSNKFVGKKARGSSETPSYLYLGESAKLSITVTNSGVGHNFPGGTTDINEAWVMLSVVDGEGHEVYRSGTVQSDGEVDSEAYFYRSIPVDRHGQPVWKHDLFNMVGDNYKKVVPANSADVVEYAIKVPHWAKSPLTVSAVLRYRKLNNRYARWALKDDWQELPIVDVARDAITIALRTLPELDNTGTVPSHIQLGDQPPQP